MEEATLCSITKSQCHSDSKRTQNTLESNTAFDKNRKIDSQPSPNTPTKSSQVWSADKISSTKMKS
jgi:hypothetical protein